MVLGLGLGVRVASMTPRSSGGASSSKLSSFQLRPTLNLTAHSTAEPSARRACVSK